MQGMKLIPIARHILRSPIEITLESRMKENSKDFFSLSSHKLLSPTRMAVMTICVRNSTL